IMAGMTAWLLLVPLAATSTNWSIRKLGGKRWQALHRLVYVAAIAGVVHFYMQVKADVRLPLAFAAVLAVLLGYRLVIYLRQRRPVPGAATRPARPM
ncbi:MAG TPA: ferric reductase-like transmembrane domain-containing protein, partial [Candidatus Cybelea sp.]|nr:ferric reductase-like transmembrane domain-containing protein [Candidatus Cybelea sp.]